MKRVIKLFLYAAVVFSLLNSPVLAGNTTLEELENIQQFDNIKIAGNTSSDAVIAKDHWSYTTLENITKKYGLLMGKPEEKFDGNKPLTRNEAAVILVNLTGKIEQSRIQMTEAEKIKLDILKQEFKNELQALAGRVASLEESVDTIKGNITKLQEDDQKGWKADFGEKFKLNGTFQASYTGTLREGEDRYPNNFKIPHAELNLSGKLYPHIDYKIGLEAERAFHTRYSDFNGLLGDAYVSTDIIPHHNIYLGQTRVPVGHEGTLEYGELDTIDRAMIARLYGEYRDLGVKAAGSWDFIDYSIGAFNGNFENNYDYDRDMNVASWAVIKPLYKYPQLGKLELGGGYNFGNIMEHKDFSVMSYYAGYKYKKYAIRAEYMTFNYSYDDSYYDSDYDHWVDYTQDVRSKGWYVHNSYDLTKKLQLIARYDHFNHGPYRDDAAYDNRNINEYTVGANYYFIGNNLKLQVNFVHSDNSKLRNSDRIGILTQYMF